MTIARNLVLVRHGQSEANAANVFTGWSNPPLTPRGRAEAQTVAELLTEFQLYPDRVFCSPLDRCAETVRIILAAMHSPACPVERHRDLDERDYGKLTGRNKDEAGREYGAAQVRRWRRSYAEAPPGGESLRDTAARVLRCYVRAILPAAMAGGTTLVVSSGNALRSLVMTLDNLDEAQIETTDISTGAAILYELGPDTAVLQLATLHNRMEP